MSGGPVDIARMLLSYYAEHSTPMQVSLATSEQDNEYLTELLLTVYNECYRLYSSGEAVMTPEKFAQSIQMVFITVGYKLIIKPLNQYDTLPIYYAKIKPDLSMVINQYHPLMILSGMKTINTQRQSAGQPVLEIPESYEQLYADEDYLHNILAVHEHNSGGHATISFQKINGHFDQSETSQTHVAESTDQLDSTQDNTSNPNAHLINTIRGASLDDLLGTMDNLSMSIGNGNNQITLELPLTMLEAIQDMLGGDSDTDSYSGSEYTDSDSEYVTTESDDE